MSQRMKSNFILLFAALIWGTAFVAQKSGMEYMGPFTYNFARNIIGGLSMLPILIFNNGGHLILRDEKEKNRTTLKGGLTLSIVLFIATSFQQFGMQYTTVGKAGFVAALYILFVPILSIFLHRKVRPFVWLCVAVASVGVYLLSVNGDNFSMDKGAFYVLCGTIFFAMQILTVAHYAPHANAIMLTSIQYLGAGILSAIVMLIFEHPTLSSILSGWLPLLYNGVLSCGVASVLQVLGQRHAEPTEASLIMSMESVFAALSGAIIFHELMIGREYLGCLLIFISVVAMSIFDKGE